MPNPIGSSTGPAQLDAGGYVANATGGDWFNPQAAYLGPGLRWLAGCSDLPRFATHALTNTSGTVYGTRVFCPAGETLTTVMYAVQTAGGTLTTAQNLVGIYSSAGNLLWTSPDQTTNFGTTAATGATLYQLPIAPGVVVPVTGLNYVDIAFLSVGTTGVTLWQELLVTLTPAAFGTTNGGGGTDGALGWTGRTSATTLAATTGTKTPILTSIFAALG